MKAEKTQCLTWTEQLPYRVITGLSAGHSDDTMCALKLTDTAATSWPPSQTTCHLSTGGPCSSLCVQPVWTQFAFSIPNKTSWIKLIQHMANSESESPPHTQTVQTGEDSVEITSIILPFTYWMVIQMSTSADCEPWPLLQAVLWGGHDDYCILIKPRHKSSFVQCVTHLFILTIHVYKLQSD